MSELTFLSLGYAVEHLLASAIVALVVLALLKARAITAEARAGVLFVALMLCSAVPLLPLPEVRSVADNSAAGNGAAGSSGAGTVVAAPAVSREAASKTSEARGAIEMTQPVALLLVALWLAGAAFQLGRHAKGHVCLRRIVAASRRSLALESDYREILPNGVEIRLSDSFGPAVAGILRPTILIPEQLAARLPEHALRAVLLHEASHVRRNDLLANALQKMAEAVFWWNPAIRWMGKTLDAAREAACDVRASRSCETPADYADALLTAVEHIAVPREARFASALSVSSSLHALDRRIDSIIEERRSGPRARAATIGALFALVAVCVVACAVSRPLKPVPAAQPDVVAVSSEVAAARVTPAADLARSVAIADAVRTVEAPEPARAVEVPQPAQVVEVAKPARPVEVVQPVRPVAPGVAPVVPVPSVPATPAVPAVEAVPPKASEARKDSSDASEAQAAYSGYLADLEKKHRQYLVQMEAKHREYAAISQAKHQEYVAVTDAQDRELTETYTKFNVSTEAERRELLAAVEAQRRRHSADAERERREFSADAERERREYSAATETERREH